MWDDDKVLFSHFSSVQSLSRVWLFATLWIAARQASLSITNSRSLLKLMSIESGMPSRHLILCRPLLFLPPILPSIRVFSNESTPNPTTKFSFQNSTCFTFLLKSHDWFEIFLVCFLKKQLSTIWPSLLFFTSF